MLTQFQSHTLNSHLTSAYPPVRFGGPDHQAWVDVLAAQQTVTEKEWCAGSGSREARDGGGAAALRPCTGKQGAMLGPWVATHGHGPGQPTDS